jgi:hypothetical protein
MSTTNSMDAALDTWRALDWRAKRAQQLVQQRRHPSPRTDDPLTAALARFFRDRSSAGPDSRSRPTPKALIDAVRLAEEPVGLRRGVVEARVLAGQSPDEIAHCSGITAESVKWFEASYYDVRERLVFDNYILLSVIGPRPASTGEWATFVWVCKRVAYPRGVSALDGFLGCTDLQHPDKLPSLVARTRRAQKVILSQCALAASTTVNPNDPILATRLAEHAAKVVSGESDGDSSNPILANIKACGPLARCAVRSAL